MVDRKRRVIVEEHIVFIGGPGNTYLGHVVPESGTAAHIMASISTFITNNSNEVFAVGCDGTNTNTGNKGGVVTLLEQKLNRLVQWLICQLHANELPLRHFINHLDGETNGPRGFTGPIGRKLINCDRVWLL